MRQIVSQTRVNGCIWVHLTPCLSCAKALKNPGLAWGVGMEPSGFEPLTPCMPCSLLIGANQLHCKGFAGLLHCVLRQTVSQINYCN